MPRFLTAQSERLRTVDSVTNLAHFRRNPEEVLSLHVKWILQYTLERNWVSAGEPAPKKEETVKSSGKVRGRIFSCKEKVPTILRVVIGLHYTRSKEKRPYSMLHDGKICRIEG